jgi:hypothetical protein
MLLYNAPSVVGTFTLAMNHHLETKTVCVESIVTL